MKEINKYLDSVVFTPAVVGYLRDEDRVCLGVRKKVSFGLGENLIAGIGGKIGDVPKTQGETPMEAMKREVLEEIGVMVVDGEEMGRLRFMFSHKPSDSTWNQDVVIYSVTKWEGTPVETESTKPIWFNTRSIPWEHMWEDNEHWLPKVLLGQRVNAIFLFSDDNKLSEFRFEES